MIDLRSDTVTRPTPAMRRAMAEAEVGDDVYGEDPTVNRLEARCAELFGRPAALFVSSGTMANLIALQCHAEPGSEVLLDPECHVYNYEAAGITATAGLLPRVVVPGGPVLAAEDLRGRFHGGDLHRTRTALLWLENTHNRRGGAVTDAPAIAGLAAAAHAHGALVHLDGARIWNAAVALGVTPAALAAPVDSLSCCFSKGLGAPVGSLLAGSEEFIARARRARKRLGGALRQAGVLAAAALVALEESPPRLHRDHEHARQLAEVLADLGFVLDPAAVRTNIVIAALPERWPAAAAAIAALREHGVLAGALDGRRLRFVTHRDVSPGDLERAIDGIRLAAHAAQPS